MQGKSVSYIWDRIIFHMRPASESRRYNVTSSLIGWVHTQNDPWTETWRTKTQVVDSIVGHFERKHHINMIKDMHKIKCIYAKSFACHSQSFVIYSTMNDYLSTAVIL